MKTKEWIAIVIVVIVVAVLASLITSSITGNVIKVSEVKKGTSVYTQAEVDSLIKALKTAVGGFYTKAEIDSKLNTLDTKINAISAKLDSHIAGGTTPNNPDKCSELSSSIKQRIVEYKQTASQIGSTFLSIEGEKAKINDYLLIYSPSNTDKARILQVKALPSGASSTDYMQLDDVVSGETFKFRTGYVNYTSGAIAGDTYWAYADINRTDSALTTAQLAWGAGSSASSSGINTGEVRDALIC